MKLLRTLLLILLAVLLLAPTAALYAIASTQAGLRLVAAHLGRIGPVKITIEQVSGTLIDGFTVASLRVQERHADVRITDAAGRLRLLPLLLQRRIELSGARARQVSVQVFHVAAAQSSGRLRFMPPTFGVEVDAARADNVDLVLISGRRLHATSAAAGIQVLSGVIHIRDGQLDWQETHMAVTGDVRAADPVGLDGRISADWHPQGKPAWQFTASFDGDLDRLPLKLDIAKPFHAHAEGAATALEGNWKFAGKGATRDLDISVFGGGDA
ncbi:MAG TPA: hypothetical protein VMH77_08410, partial [Steroidobacteraceae bacterium]|nr:hypothetical protein [Steroidobacteraceae bacterium]